MTFETTSLTGPVTVCLEPFYIWSPVLPGLETLSFIFVPKRLELPSKPQQRWKLLRTLISEGDGLFQRLFEPWTSHRETAGCLPFGILG